MFGQGFNYGFISGGPPCFTDTTDIFKDNSGVALYTLDYDAKAAPILPFGTIVEGTSKIIDLDVSGYTSGATISDKTSNNNNATIFGNVTYSNGRFNLDGASDYLKINASTTFNSAANFTVEGWFKPDNITDLEHFFTIWDGGSNSKFYLRFNGTSGDLDAYTYTSAGTTSAQTITSNAAVRVKANVFNHIVMTYADGGSGSLAVYINGALAGSTTPSAAVNTTGTQDLYIGVLQSYIGSYDFDGEVGQVRFYNSALTASEVLQNYNATVYNYINYDGTPTAVDFGIAGKTLYSARFNGSSSKIDLPDNILPDNSTGSSSASVWFKSSSGNTAGDSECILDAYAYDTNKPGWGLFMEPAYGGNPDGHLYLANYSLGGTSGGTSVGYRDGSWHHAVVVLDNPNNTIKVYLDGNTSTPILSQTASATNVWPFTEKSAIGYQNANASYPRYFNGTIDQVRIFNKVITASEIGTLYGNGLGEIACEYTPTTTNINYPVTNHSYYKFDNCTPTNIEYAFGRYGQAAVFNGSSSQINLPTGDLSLGTNNISVSLWFNSANITQDNQSLFWFQHYQNPIRMGAVVSSTSAGMGGDNDVRFYCYSSGSLDLSTNSDILSSNTWYHAVFVKSSTSGMTIYINGASVATLPSATGNLNTNMTSGGANSIGYYKTTASNLYFNGSIDQFRMYSSALTQAQVTKLYNEKPEVYADNFKAISYQGNNSTKYVSSVGFKPDLTWIKVSSASGYNYNLFDVLRGPTNRLMSNLTNAQDSNGALTAFEDNGFSLSAGGDANPSQSLVAWNWKAGGFANKSATFNGSSSYISLPNNLVNSVSPQQFSVSFWFKNNNLSAYANPFSAYDWASGVNYGWNIWAGYGTSKLRFISYSSNGDIDVSGATTLTQGVWYHAAVTYDNGTLKMYLNGSQDYSGTGFGNRTYLSNHKYFIGAATNGAGGTEGYFTGQMDQIRIFSKSLSSTEVQTLYNETASTINTLQILGDTSCIATYPLGVGAGDVGGTHSGTASNVTFNNLGHLTINTDGTLVSTVSANPDAGFSIIRNTGTSNYSDTVGHGLSQAPELIIQKGVTASTDWYVLVTLSGTGAWDWTKINSTLAFSADSPQRFATSSTTINNWGWTNYDMINYCWHSVAGYSKIGTYVGSGATNNVSVGFTPSWVMIKNTTAAGSFLIYDAARSPYDPRDKSINLTYTTGETTQSSMRVNFNSISDGFTLLGSFGGTNQNGITYLYMAFK